MSGHIIISVENLGKRYSLRHQRNEPYTALRDVITDKAKSFFRRNGKETEMTREDFWALKSVSFKVERGEVLGLIGRNGAGKTTLLKILSRITDPTEGQIRIRGRVASLLEVGTGFHPELTGRENIFLNGAILGMTKAEIKSKFDEIVAFAEVEKFLDLPVKRYSSGMYVRLAFAVAAHLDSEILIVDEVLAVGDTSFQKKCIGKMQEVTARDRRTVLIVSHSMAAIRGLCRKCIYLDNGTIVQQGSTDDVVNRYVRDVSPTSLLESAIENAPRTGDCGARIRLLSVKLHPAANRFVFGEPLRMTITARAESDLEDVFFGLSIKNESGARLIVVQSYDHRISLVRRGSVIDATVEIPEARLSPGTFSLSVGINAGLQSGLDFVSDAVLFGVVPDANEMLVEGNLLTGVRPRSYWQIRQHSVTAADFGNLASVNSAKR